MAGSWTALRSRLGVAIRTGAPTQVIDGLRRDLRATVTANHLREAVAADPPFTADQLAELAEIVNTAAAATRQAAAPHRRPHPRPHGRPANQAARDRR
jgi:hypothetical protein